MAQFGRHTVTSATFQKAPTSLNTRAGDGRFGLSVGINEIGFVRVGRDEPVGSVIPFFCVAHGPAMVTPLGGILVY